MRCGNSDRPSSVSWTRPVRTICERSSGDGRQNDGLVHPVGLADELPAQAESVEHLNRAAGDAVRPDRPAAGRRDARRVAC